MPKIIENPEGRLVAEARRQAREGGYSAVTIRSVAAACGLGVGTVYNYFPSKDALLAAFLLEDWKECLQSIEEAKAVRPEACWLLGEICRQLKAYLAHHRSIFCDPAAAQAVSPVINRYHSILREQLAMPLRSFCADGFHAQFLAEALLTWIVEGREARSCCLFWKNYCKTRRNNNGISREHLAFVCRRHGHQFHGL